MTLEKLDPSDNQERGDQYGQEAADPKQSAHQINPCVVSGLTPERRGAKSVRLLSRLNEKEASRLSGLRRVGITRLDCVSTDNQTKEKSPVLTITIGVDLAKLPLSIRVVDTSGRVVQRKELRRDAFSRWLSQQPAEV